METAVPWQASRPAAQGRNSSHSAWQNQFSSKGTAAPGPCRPWRRLGNEFAFFGAAAISACARRQTGYRLGIADLKINLRAIQKCS